LVSVTPPPHAVVIFDQEVMEATERLSHLQPCDVARC
jgi:hypothetical protein